MIWDATALIMTSLWCYVMTAQSLWIATGVNLRNNFPITIQNLWKFRAPFIYFFTPWSLTDWGRVTHICVSNLTIIGSDNDLSPDRRQAIIWTNAGILLICPLGTNFSEILIEILTFSFKKMRLKVSSARWRPFCLCRNVLTNHNGYAAVASTNVCADLKASNQIAQLWSF